MIGSFIAGALNQVYLCAGYVLGKWGGSQLEIDAHAFVLLEAHALVIEVGIALVLREPAGDLLEPGLFQHLECGALWLGDMRLAAEGFDVPYVFIARSNIEITGQEKFRLRIIFRIVRQVIEKVQLVVIVAVRDLAAVGHVEGPHFYATDAGP